jgi:hypothetical protein
MANDPAQTSNHSSVQMSSAPVIHHVPFFFAYQCLLCSNFHINILRMVSYIIKVCNVVNLRVAPTAATGKLLPL